MCLIVYRPAGIELDEDLLLAAGRQNSDGVGLMWCRDGVIHTRRSLDTTKVFKFIREAGTDIPIAIHFRYATHGTKTLDNCHPFRVTDELYLMHNGVLPVYDKGKVLSDTATFARLILRPVVQDRPELIMDPSFRMMIEMTAGSSNKFLMLRNDGGTGEYFWANESLGTWKDKVWYSSGLPYRSTYSTTGYQGGRNYQGGYKPAEYKPPVGGSTTTGSTAAKPATQSRFVSDEAYGETDWSHYGASGITDRMHKAEDSEDTAPFGASPVEGTSTDTGANEDKQYEAYTLANRTKLGPRDRSADQQTILDEARDIADQFLDSMLINDEELKAMLMDEYGYDIDEDRLVAMGVRNLG